MSGRRDPRRRGAGAWRRRLEEIRREVATPGAAPSSTPNTSEPRQPCSFCGGPAGQGVAAQYEWGVEILFACEGLAHGCYPRLIHKLQEDRVRWRWLIKQEIRENRVLELDRPRWRGPGPLASRINGAGPTR